MSWLDLDMEIEQHLHRMDERMKRGFTQLLGRMEAAERHWEEDERARRKEWEVLEGRAMTAMEEHRHYNDGLLRKMDVMLRSEEHTSELQSQFHLVCRLLLEKKKKNK